MRIRPIRAIVLGFFLALFGFIAPLLMVIEVIPSTFLLNFLSYSASIVGLLLGIIGVAGYRNTRRE